MNMIIKTDFGEFNFNLDNKSAQDVVNLALTKAANRDATMGKNAVVVAATPPAADEPKTEPAPIPAADLLKNLADRVGENVHKGGTNMANALLRATSKSVSPTDKPKSRAEALFGDRGGWDMPAAEKKDTGKKESYTGFLHIKCNKCGHIKTFYCRHDMTFFKCNECGHSFNLRDLKPAHARCGCRAYQTYHTNETEAEIKIPCRACRVPTKLILNKAGTTYVMPKPWDTTEESDG